MIPYLPMILTAVAGIAAAFEPNVQAFIAANPTLAAILATVSALLTAWLKSPRQ